MPQPKDKGKTKPYPTNVRHCIKRQGYTIQEVADEIGIPRRTLTHYLSGNAPIPRQCLEKIAYTIGCEIEEFILQSVHDSRSQTVLGIAKEQRQRDSAPEQVLAEHSSLAAQDVGNTHMSDHTLSSRRDFLRQTLSVTGAALVATPQELLSPPLWERLSRALTQSSRVDETAIHHLEMVTKSYWQLRTDIAYRDLLSGFLGHLETVTQLLQGSQSLTIHNRLCTVAGEVAQLVGAILFDMNDYTTAQAYYKVSLDAAREAENHTLLAIGLGRVSLLSTYKKQAPEALPYLEEAQRLATLHAPVATRAWLAAVEAEAHANARNTYACLQALEQAEQLVQQAESSHDASWVRLNRSRLAGYKGVCYLHLQQPKAALVALTEADHLIDASSLRQRSIILTDAATASLQQGEVEQGCKRASQALTMTTQTKSAMVIQRLREFREHVKPWEAMRPVKELDEQIATYVAITS